MNADTPARITLATLPKHFRQLALWFLITLTVGYTAGLIFVTHTTGITPKGVEERYRGNQNETAAAAPGAASSGTLPSDSAGTADTISTVNGILPSDTASTINGVLPSDTSSTVNGVLPPDTPSAGAASHPAPGPAGEQEMKFEKSLPEMLNITHTHILAMTSFLVLAAAIFALTSRPSARLKSFLIVEPFVAILTSFAAMWLMRYVHPAFSYLLMLSSGSFALCFYAMVILSLRELVGRMKDER